MFEKYKNYSDSFLEVVLNEVNRKIDLKLKSIDFNYGKAGSYNTYYFKYIVPGNSNINKLTDLLRALKEDSYMLLPLPWDETIQKHMTKEESFNDLIDELHPIISDEVIENSDFYLAKMIESGTSDSLPLFFNGFDELDTFLNLDSNDIEHYFIGTLLLFPLNMNWYMIFDYDLFAIHFIDGGRCFSELGEEFKSNEFVYSENQIEQLKRESEE